MLNSISLKGLSRCISDANLADKAFIVGFIGDAVLQIVAKYYGKFAGLEEYYKLHGPVESLFIAAGLMYAVIRIYMISGLPITLTYLSIYAALLDLAFRYLRVMPTLDAYYKRFSIIATIIFAIISIIIPKLI